jgi:3-oxoadipate enol-lactonase
MPFAHINGADLYYEVHGEGPAVLLSHGVGSNHLHWWQQIPVLSKNFKVITFDHRGFGFSGEDGKGPKAFVDDVAGLLDHLRIGKVAVVGQSMGGVTVTGFASRFPDRVTAMVLSCSGGGVVPVKHAPSMKGALEKCRDYMEFAALSISQDGFRQRKPALCFLFESIAQTNRAVDLKLLLGMRELKNDVTPIAKAKIPTLLIGGEDDHGANGALQELQTLIPGASLAVVPDAGHLLFFESADKYNELVGGFLGRHLH